MDELLKRIIHILEKSPADQFSIYRELQTVAMADVSKAIAKLQQQNLIHVVKYRKSGRTGTNIPIYSVKEEQRDQPDLVKLLPGVTSERVVEYDFLARNLLSRTEKAVILDFGCNWHYLDEALRDFGKGNWKVLGIDIKDGGCDAIMDLRFAGLRSGVAGQVICISTVEHIGLSASIHDELGDRKVIAEMFRVLRPGGIAVLTLPYGSKSEGKARVYDRPALSSLVKPFRIVRKEFYTYVNGRWERSSQAAADRHHGRVPDYFHSGACACLLLAKP